MKLNLFKRSMIFATFFGSCLCIALIVASLGTTHWIDARARRTHNPHESEGIINFGLFEGHKELNFGYGWRSHDFGVRNGTLPARRWAWCGAAGLLAGALAAAAGACVLAALAAAARHRARARPLLATNSLAALLSAGAAAVWLAEYLLRLRHNVMSDEDLANTWSSDGRADLGLSFWLVVGAGAAALCNCVCVAVGAAGARAAAEPAGEEKVSAAIMLY